jgi:hypothetical protein
MYRLFALAGLALALIAGDSPAAKTKFKQKGGGGAPLVALNAGVSYGGGAALVTGHAHHAYFHHRQPIILRSSFYAAPLALNDCSDQQIVYQPQPQQIIYRQPQRIVYQQPQRIIYREVSNGCNGGQTAYYQPSYYQPPQQQVYQEVDQTPEPEPAPDCGCQQQQEYLPDTAPAPRAYYGRQRVILRESAPSYGRGLAFTGGGYSRSAFLTTRRSALAVGDGDYGGAGLALNVAPGARKTKFKAKGGAGAALTADPYGNGTLALVQNGGAQKVKFKQKF